jgi:hypothetical protein
MTDKKIIPLRREADEEPEDHPEPDQDDGGKQPPQTQTLLDIAESATLFHAPNGAAFADIMVNGHRETWPIRMKGFRRWLVQRFYIATQKAPGSEALQQAINVIEARAHYEGEEHTVSLRVGAHHDKIYLDLADNSWRAIEISDEGWRIVERPPAHFRRSAGMMPLPVPVEGGSVDTLKQFLNVQNEEQFILAIAWVLAALRNCGPYPVLALAGEQGSAKSTCSKLLRWLIDPNSAPLRALPREDRDLFIAANNGHVLSFDNVSGLPHWISDTICRLATGGGFSVRQLYSDQDEILFDAQRPVILNGIEDIVERPNLADRSLFLTLDPIPKNKRRPEREIMDEFEKARPEILGALLDALVVGLQCLDQTELDELPRMADFAIWMTACESALWKKGTFISAYTGNIDEATKSLIEGDIVSAAVVEFMAGKPEWTGATKDLLHCLDAQVGERVNKRKEWPTKPEGLAGRLRRLAPSLRRSGLEINRLPREAGLRPIRLAWAEGNGIQPSFPSGPSAGADFRHSWMTVDEGQPSHQPSHQPSRQPSHRKPLETKGNDSGDRNDGQNGFRSGDQFDNLRDDKWRMK